MKRDEVLQKIESARSSGEILNLSRVDLYGVDLSQVDLSGANLSSATLTNANLHNAKLVGADLSKADLTFARLDQADLSRANLRQADLRQADLTGTNLTGANLDKAKGIDRQLLEKLASATLSAPLPTKLSLDNKKTSASQEREQTLEGIPHLTLPTRWELLQPKIEANNVSLRTIVQPVYQAMDVVKNITEYLSTTSGCQVLVIRAETGSGKTTFLNTLPYYPTSVTISSPYVQGSCKVRSSKKHLGCV